VLDAEVSEMRRRPPHIQHSIGRPRSPLDQLGCPHIGYHYGGTDRDLKYAYIPPHYVSLPLWMRDYP
jgi:hypothetical protein